MKTLIFVAACAFIIACNQTPRGDDPERRDSIGDPIQPRDTTVERLDPDSVTDSPKVDFK